MMARRQWLLYGGVALGTFGALWISQARAKQAPQGYRELDRLAKRVDRYIPGFSKWARGVAYNESRGNSDAHNTSSSEVAASCRGYDNKYTRYAHSPYGRADFCIGSGGWFGFIPSTALAADGFQDQNPQLVFDPAASVALLAAFVRRVVRGHWNSIPPEHRTWLTMRRFMAGNTVGLDWDEQKVLRSDHDGIPRSRKIRERFAADLQKVGVSANLMYQRVRIRNWPGALALWKELDS